MNFPASPYFVLERLLDEYRSGQRTLEDVAGCLDIYDMFVEQWSEGLEALPVDPEVLPEGESIIEGCAHSLGFFADASACMRDFLETGDEALADQALELARQGHENLEQIYLPTAQRVAELQNEVG